MLFDLSNTSTDQKICIGFVLMRVTFWDLYILSNEIKIFLIIIDHKRHLAMCIMTPK
jgi:hypothetical protein